MIDEFLIENGWHRIKNEYESVIYTKKGHETDLFEMSVDKNYVYVTIPLRNSSYQFRTKFNDYFQATEYMEGRFRDFYGPR
jgi:hypothetical protein